MFTFIKPAKPEKPVKKDKPIWKLCSVESPPWKAAVLFNVAGSNEDEEDLPTEMFTGVLTMIISTEDSTTLKVRTLAGEITLPAERTEWMQSPKPSRKQGGST